MNSLWRSFFGFTDDDDPQESYGHAVGRARHLMEIGDYEGAFRILRYAERNRHAEAMYLLGWCYWDGRGVAEDAGHAAWLWRESASLGYEPAVKRCGEIKGLNLSR